MAAHPKQLSQQKILQILQTCKQIPKDDRLYLRKMIKEGDQGLLLILSDFSKIFPYEDNKKLQIRLRKYIQKCKQNKKNEVTGNTRQNTVIDVKALSIQGTPNHYRMALSLEKNRKRSTQIHKVNIKQFQTRQKSQQHNALRASCGNVLGRPRSNMSFSNKKYPAPLLADCQQQRKPQGSRYTLQNNYLKQYQSPTFNYSCNNSLYTPNNLLNWQSLKIPSLSVGQQSNLTSMFHSNNTNTGNVNTSTIINSISSSIALSPIPVCNASKDQQSMSGLSLLSRIKNSQINLKEQRNPQKDLCNFKSTLIKYYAEDIFDHIVTKHFPINSNQRSVYLPYKQLLSELQAYLKEKGQNLQFMKQSDMKVPLMQPFTGEFQAVSIKNLGTFLNKLCLHKNNEIRSIFIVLDACDKDSNGVSFQKFKKINSWKGQQLVQSFDKLVKKWGENSCIGYWQVYRAKKQQQYVNFNTHYTKM